MSDDSNLLTISEVAVILNVNEATVRALMLSGRLRGSGTQEKPLFTKETIAFWLSKRLSADTMANKEYLDKLREEFQEQFPEAMAELQEINAKFPRPKLYSLQRVFSKRYGDYLWYVRYMENGKMIPSRWSTHTTDKAYAEEWARENRERIIAKYHARKKNHSEFFEVLEQYYAPDSAYLAIDGARGTVLSEKTRSICYHFVNKVLIKFFKSQGVTEFDDITPPVIAALQNKLLRKGNKAQTINRYMGILRTILNHLVMNGTITVNVFKGVTPLKEKASDSKVRGCYEVDRLKGVFNRRWKDGESYILCLIIYSTGLRNSEIEKIRFCDIIMIEDCRFIDVTKSKTRNGVRVVPLHNFVYRKTVSFMKGAGKKPEDYIFSAKGGPNQSKLYNKAASDLADMLKAEEEERKDITFYSGRHYWKTLMNAEGLGDIEEYFMAHKVSKDVAKRYNHLDKQGRKNLVKKAREVFGILDKWLFR
jgi:integrase